MSTLTRVIVADDADAQTSKKLPAEFLLNPKRITEIFYTWGFFALYRYSSNIGYVLTALRAYASAAALCAHCVARIRAASTDGKPIRVHKLRSYSHREHRAAPY